MANDMGSDNNMHINLSTSGEKIKYYEYNDESCIFEILDENISGNDIDMECNTLEETIKSTQAIPIDNDSRDSDCSYENYICDKQDTYTSDILESKEFNYYDNEYKQISGEIIVVSCINFGGKNKSLEGAKINLYKLNGICPMFVRSIFTDKHGVAVFSNLPEGCYRVIGIVNKNYFEKPKYINWNEVNINMENTNAKVIIINRLKNNCRRNCR
ncbi:MSCRAMM family protein [Clostridium aquiflavi]|uniref:Prealbumin-like fold domain-containing protein n=1 Tax=Clostridium aquiflavi TaxID=3073603 RepID=A0ABU1EJ16_9CLOT|nr:prealbumin-like fold domain-containing protein [Clostridium sp. 5N-1]MDR5588394.1 prealbumin-like fold domain-containing protein [Clostridium sp. 5N-1]